jgi:hypothetical protein
MELNKVEEYLKKVAFASVNVLAKNLQINKKQIRRLIAFSKHLKVVEPFRVGSMKNYVSVFEYNEYQDDLFFFERRKLLLKKKKKNIGEE